jgi:hypothetical protein
MILENFEFARGIGLAVVAILVATFHDRAVEGHGSGSQTSRRDKSHIPEKRC